MANTQTAVPLFVANAVLTAAQQNLSAGTGVPVFATTVTRDAAFGGSNKALAEGQLCYLESTNVVQYYDGAAWATVGPASASALTLVKSQVIGTSVATTTVTNAFSATYDAYKIVVSGGVNSSGNNFFFMTLGASATGYYWALNYNAYNSTAAAAAGSNAAQWEYLGFSDTSTNLLNLEIVGPFAAKFTTFSASCQRTNLAGMTSGIHQVSTSFTDFTLSQTGTLTGGTIFVYGYAKA